MAVEQLTDVVERCRYLTADKYTAEDHNDFTAAGRTCIEEGNSLHVLSIVQDEKNQELVSCMGWNLLPPLVPVILKEDDPAFANCLAIFNHLQEKCQPKELLIGLLDQLEHEDPDHVAERIHLLMKPLQKALLCLGQRKAPSLGMTLCSIVDQTSKLPVPLTPEQEEDDVFSFCRTCDELLDFVRPFVQETEGKLLSGGATGKLDRDKEDEQQIELLKFCMKTLSQLLLEVQLRDADTLPDSPLRNFASQILKILRSIGVSLSALMFQPLTRRRQAFGLFEDEVRYPEESLASLAHLVFVHHLAADFFPSVFSPVFCLRCNMEHVSVLLARTEDFKVHKGLELYEESLVRVENSSLPVSLLEIKAFLTVPQNLVKVMTLCPHRDLRTKALKLFQTSIDKFDTEAKYQFFLLMLRISNHSGVEGFIVRNIKNQLDHALQSGNGNAWFEGVHLLPLLRRVFILPEGPETDLLQNLDRVMDSLNLLRFLLIRDKASKNRTGIWTELRAIEDSYTKPLRVALKMSKAHYEMELNSSKRSGSKESPLSVSVGEEKLPNMTPESQIEALHSALQTFDMMESVLARIEELVETKDNQ